MGVTLFAAWAIYVLLNGKVSVQMCWLCASAAVGLVLAEATSSVYIGVHYPSCVLGSMLAGMVWSCTCIAGYPQLERQCFSRRLVHGA